MLVYIEKIPLYMKSVAHEIWIEKRRYLTIDENSWVLYHIIAFSCAPVVKATDYLHVETVFTITYKL